MPKSSRLSSGCRSARWITAVPFDCRPIATPDPESRAPSWAMNATSATRRTRTMRGSPPPSRDAFADRVEHVAVVEVGDRATDRVGERRADRNHHLRRVVARFRTASFGHDRLGSDAVADERGRRDDLRQRLEKRPALALEAIAGPRPGVLVGVVHRRAHEAVRVDHRRRLQVVRRDPLALHAEHGLGDVGEPAPVERERDVEARRASREQLVGRLDVGGSIAIRHLARVVAGGRDGDLGVRDHGQAELGEHGLHGAGSSLAHGQELLLGDGLDARIDLPVALDRQPLVEVVGVEVAAAERVVVSRHHRVARGHEVRPRQGTGP